MSKHLERDLEALEQEMLAQSSLVEAMISIAGRAICTCSTHASADLFAREEEINQREVLIEEECLKILALHQPVAVDLRRVATILKINADLERIADLAVNVAERAHDVADYPELKVPQTLQTMVDQSLAMVRDALDAFVEQDAALARKVCRRDDEIDALNLEVIDELHVIMQNNSHLVVGALHLFSASRQVERIADHATNIAEDVLYLVEGAIARHHARAPESGVTES